MGFFGGSTTHVASTVYNLAGDEASRPNFLKSLVLGQTLTQQNGSMAETLQRGYMEGRGMKLRSFQRWAENHYGDIGVPAGSFYGLDGDNVALVEANIPAEPGMTVRIQRYEIAEFDYAYFAEQYMFANHRERMDYLWGSDLDPSTGRISLIQDMMVFDYFDVTVDMTSDFIYAIYHQVDANNVIGPAQVFIYEVGSGNAALDALGSRVEGDDLDAYVPFIPVRLDNQFLSETFEPEAYALAKKAYRKALDSSLDDIIQLIANNESIDDIDYAYVMFGVPLNTKQKEGKDYLFRFFRACYEKQVMTTETFTTQQAALEEFEEQAENWRETQYAVQLEVDEGNPGDPTPPGATAMPIARRGGKNVVQIKATGTLNSNLNIRLNWGAIFSTTSGGLCKPEAKAGDVFLEVLGGSQYPEQFILDYNRLMGPTANALDQPLTIDIIKQHTDDSWERIRIFQLVHKNTIYNNKSVEITASNALLDEDVTGFLVPLHYGIVREMRLVDSTQMMTEASNIVFNSYKVVKQKWYQTGIFKLVVFILIIVITIMFPPAGGAAGILGSSAAVGAAIGLTGLAALIAGAVINALAAMILTQVIMKVSVLVLGEKWGQLIGSIVAIATINIATALNNGMTLAQAFNTMMSASSLIQITSAVGNGVAGFMQASARETMRKTQELQEQNALELKNLADQFAEEFGYGSVLFNPMSLTDTSIGNFVETEEAFLKRTLLTGSDIAEMTHDMISNYTTYNLKLDLRPLS